MPFLTYLHARIADPARERKGGHHVAEEDVDEEDDCAEEEKIAGGGRQPRHKVGDRDVDERLQYGDGQVRDDARQHKGAARVGAIRHVLVGDVLELRRDGHWGSERSERACGR